MEIKDRTLFERAIESGQLRGTLIGQEIESRLREKREADLADLIEAQKHASFTHPSEAAEEDALGIMIASHFKWDGAAILRTAYYALEDANFHELASKLDDLHREEMEGQSVEDLHKEHS